MQVSSVDGVSKWNYLGSTDVLTVNLNSYVNPTEIDIIFATSSTNGNPTGGTTPTPIQTRARLVGCAAIYNNREGGFARARKDLKRPDNRKKHCKFKRRTKFD